LTLNEWIRSQPTRCLDRGPPRNPAAREGRMSDTEFGLLMHDPEAGLPAVTQQTVSLWRKKQRRPALEYCRRIEAVTSGAVTEKDLR
jgi:Putative antitoxin of bacterial toxin-antitoxin system, YdaS/YdaT